MQPWRASGVRHPTQELVGDTRVGLGPVALVTRQGAGLVRDGVRNGDATKVVDQMAEPNIPTFLTDTELAIHTVPLRAAIDSADTASHPAVDGSSIACAAIGSSIR